MFGKDKESADEAAQRRTQQALGVGLGVGLAGALAVALRYAFRTRRWPVMPDTLSPAIFADRVFPTSRGQMVYHICGSGNPLIFLHGVYPGASSFEWSRVYPEFTLDFEVIAPDLIGFGESERPAKPLDLRDQSESLIEFFHLACGDRKPVIVASGIGAKLALFLASQHPEFFEQLILWAPTGVRKALRGKTARHALGISKLAWVRSIAWNSQLSNPAWLRTWVANIGFEEPTAEDEEVTAALSTCTGLYQSDKAVWGFFDGTFGDDLSNRLGAVACPVQILWPEDSPLFPRHEVETLGREIPQNSLRLLPAGGVLAPLRHPAFFRDVLKEILHHPFSA